MAVARSTDAFRDQEQDSGWLLCDGRGLMTNEDLY
jgi:hypothetical protein